jgi:protein ImuA
MAGRNDRLAALRRRLEALERPGRDARTALPFAVPAVDKALPGKGLALGALHEVAGAGAEEEDGAVAAAFLAGILARLKPPLPILWCLAEGDLYGPGLAAAGLDTGRLILAQARRPQELLWAMEEGLKSSGLAAVVGEVAALSLPASRRLLLAAEASGVTGFALRRWRSGDDAAGQRQAPNAALTRWRAWPRPAALAGRALALPRQRADVLDDGGVRCDGSCRSGCRAGRSIGGAPAGSPRRISLSSSPSPSATGASSPPSLPPPRRWG